MLKSDEFYGFSCGFCLSCQKNVLLCLKEGDQGVTYHCIHCDEEVMPQKGSCCCGGSQGGCGSNR